MARVTMGDYVAFKDKQAAAQAEVPDGAVLEVVGINAYQKTLALEYKGNWLGFHPVANVVKVDPPVIDDDEDDGDFA